MCDNCNCSEEEVVVNCTLDHCKYEGEERECQCDNCDYVCTCHCHTDWKAEAIEQKIDEYMEKYGSSRI